MNNHGRHRNHGTMEFTTNALKGLNINSLRVLTLGIETPTNPRSVGAEQND